MNVKKHAEDIGIEACYRNEHKVPGIRNHHIFIPVGPSQNALKIHHISTDKDGHVAIIGEPFTQEPQQN